MKRFFKFIFILLPVLSGSRLFAQKQGQALIDSLLQVLPASKEDTNKVKLLNDLSFTYYSVNTDEGIKYGQQALDLATKLGWEKGMASANGNIGVNYQYKSDYPRALACFNTGLEIAEKSGNKRSIAANTGRIGNIYFYQGDYPKALDYYLKNLKLEEEIGDKQGYAKALSNIAGIYYMQQDFSKTLEYGFRALKIYEDLGDKQGEAGITGNISNVYHAQKDYPKALEYGFKALKIAEELQDKDQIAGIVRSIGPVYTSQKNYIMAIEYLQGALKTFEEMGNKYDVALTMDGLGSAYLSLAEDTVQEKPYVNIAAEQLPGARYVPDAAIPAGKTARLHKTMDYLEKSLVIGKELHAPAIIQDAYEYLSEASRLGGDYKKALEYSNMFHRVKDSVFSKENDEKIVKMDLKHEYDRERLADSLRTSEREKITHFQVQRQRIISYVGFGSLILVSLLLFFIYRNYNLQKKANLIIQAEKENAERQRGRAEASERFKQQFLTNMSHEIRTPMNAVLGMTNLTLDTDLTPKQAKYLTAVKKSSENLLVIINDILDLSKLEAGKMELERIPFSLSEQVNHVYDTLQFKAEEKGLILHTEIGKDVPDVLVGDPSRLNQVLINLCGNAIKFTDKGIVRLAVNKVQDNGGAIPAEGERIMLRFRVIDSGIGIPADKIDKLFEAFRQADAGTSRKYGGTGLGLSISKTLVELQGGKIEAKSEEGKGSEFSFMITYEIADEKAAAALIKETKADHASLGGIRILVAEDNEYNQVVIKDTLENLIDDAKVDIAGNGKIAVEKLVANDYDLVLMDVHMPEMNGLEATAYIRHKTPGNKRNIPVIALTASVLSTDLNKCTDAGMNDYIPKPFTRAQLINTVAKYYKNESPRDERAIDEKIPEQHTPVENDRNTLTDLAFLRKFCDGNAAKMKKYIDVYLKLTPEELGKINKALSEKEYPLLLLTVHGMKPRFDFMGMKQTRAIAEKIEVWASGQNDPEHLKEMIGQLQSDYERSKAELMAFS